MRSNIFTRLAMATAGTALSLALVEVNSAQATILYSVTDLGSFGNYPDFTAASRINDVGQVIVNNFQYSQYSNTGILLKPAKQQIFLWENGNLIDLTAFNSLSSSGQLGFGGFASDINNNGQMVGGWTDINGESHPLLGNRYTVTDLGSFNGITNANTAQAINDLGQVVGSAIATNSEGQVQYYGWLWENGVKSGLNSVNNPSFAPLDINNLGQIVGSSFPLSQPPIYESKAVVLSQGQVIELPALNGGSQSAPLDINNVGQVVGYSDSEAVLWSNGKVLGLGILGFNANVGSVAASINDLGQIVGWSTISETSPLTGQRHAFLWNGKLEDLNNLISPDLGWELEDAVDINNKGQIVGRGILNGQYHAYLLTPLSVPQSVPEPTSALGILGFGAISIGSILKRKKPQKTLDSVEG